MNTNEYTFEELYQALQRLSKEERSSLPLYHLQYFNDVENIKLLAKIYEKPAAVLYRLFDILKSTDPKEDLKQSDVEQIEQEETPPEKQKESLIDKFYKSYKSSAVSTWYKV